MATKRKPIRVLFLDFDGVIFTLGGVMYARDKFGIERMPKYELCPVAMALLRRLLKDHKDLRIVVSSVWRIGSSKAELKRILGKGIRNRVIGKTSVTRRGYRGAEIKSWLDANKEKFFVRDFIILDDESDMRPFLGYLFKTNSYDGFQSSTWSQLDHYLKMKPGQATRVRIRKMVYFALRRFYYQTKYRITSIPWKTKNYFLRGWRLIVSNCTVHLPPGGR